MKILLTLIIIIFSINTYAAKVENLFYTTSDVTLDQIKQHAHSIHIIAPQVYFMDEAGIIKGELDQKIHAYAKEHKIKIIPLVVNTNFDQNNIHLFLHNEKAKEVAIAKMLQLCQQHNYYGIQLDFENVSIDDKNDLTQFFKQLVDQLHPHGFNVSIAVIPRTEISKPSAYDNWVTENWSGSYDYQELAKSADFISVMSYDQHTSLTTPGPIAATDWVEETIHYLLKTVPANKISLGIPVYSGYWVTGQYGVGKIPDKYTFRSKDKQFSYSKIAGILKQYHLSPSWHRQWKTSYIMFSNDNKNEYIFIEDAKSYRAKLALVHRYHLRGISVWRLGLEDPKIW